MSQPATNTSLISRYINLLVWLIVLVTLIAIPLRIMSFGYMPGGDARRHVAQALTDKTYTQILVLRPEYSMDHSPGWDDLLRSLHKAGWTEDALMSFSVIGLMLCVFYAPLPWLRRPEAWLAALLAQMIAIPEVMVRFTQGRPLLLTEGILIAILFAWSKAPARKPSALLLVLTGLGVSLSVWMHGAWYLWALPVLAFLLAQQWHNALRFLGCASAGILLGAIFTGKPIEFLRQAILILNSVSHEHIPQWMFVGELQPSRGEFETVILLAVVALWHRWQTKTTANYFRDPVFCLILVCWILGFKADRFWADWGLPASLVWLTLRFEELLPALWQETVPQRLAACCLLALPLLLHTTNDLDRRYSFNQSEFFLDAHDPTLAGWLPESNGILYHADMSIFYNTFYKNPNGDWRYVLGLEPALMRDDDLNIFRGIQWNHYAFQAYEPWIRKMLPADRLAIESPSQPNFPDLEWHHAIGNIWLGRLPKK